MDNTITDIFRCFGGNTQCALRGAYARGKDTVTEFRVRAGKPVVAQYLDGSRELLRDTVVTKEELRDAFGKLCGYSVYRRQGEINQGYITVAGGHRIGVCGTAAAAGESGALTAVTDITSLNIRAARRVDGCSREYFRQAGLSSCLIVGKPCTGKTTLLRDIARELSTTYERKVAVVDERGELAGGSDLGLCDVYTGFSKTKAILCAVRSMSPDYILCDELTGEDERSVLHCLHYGVKMIATIHGDSVRSRNVQALLATGEFGKVWSVERGVKSDDDSSPFPGASLVRRVLEQKAMDNCNTFGSAHTENRLLESDRSESYAKSENGGATPLSTPHTLTAAN